MKVKDIILFFTLCLSCNVCGQAVDSFTAKDSTVKTSDLQNKSAVFHGDMSLSSFIFENIDLTIPFYEDSIPDINMIVQFIVNVDSTISDIEIVKNQSLGSGNEISVIRAIKATSGLWTPALEGGKPVAELIRLPIRICPF